MSRNILFLLDRQIKMPRNTLFSWTAKLKCCEMQFSAKKPQNYNDREIFMPRNFHAIKYVFDYQEKWPIVWNKRTNNLMVLYPPLNENFEWNEKFVWSETPRVGTK